MSEKKSTLMQKVQRFGGAMFTPVLFFAVFGIIVGFATLFKNNLVFGSLADLRLPGTRSGISFIMEQTRYLNRCH